MGPRLIMNGLKPSMARAKYQLGQYFQTHEESNNSMSERTLDALFLEPIGNNQRRLYVLNLKIGQQIKHTHVAILLLTTDIITN